MAKEIKGFRAFLCHGVIRTWSGPLRCSKEEAQIDLRQSGAGSSIAYYGVETVYA